MSHTTDELAGVVDLFGALTADELREALSELAFKRGESVDDEALTAEIERALADYHLVEIDRDGDRLLVAGPAAFPAVPEHGPDLPHIMDVPDRDLDREAVGEAVADRLREESRTVAAAGETDRAERLLDVSYDLEAWAPVGVADVRETLDRAFESPGTDCAERTN
ncbi:DUF7109 family protein [Halorussus marinus]|uniref:DUF7109 family protein n=1 Tax=Halorussus marinus TaxID=2505976 RepID=UPI00106E651E|nr:hypothetical protein [Halorussus marinus]